VKESINKLKFEHSSFVADNALRYLNLVNDYQQYPAARCGMGANGCMYERSASSVAESMNWANMGAREKVAVDPINAMTLLLQMEVKHFNAKKEKAWNWNEELTPHGKKLNEEAFKDINPCGYQISINQQGDEQWNCRVSRLNSTNTYQCFFKAVEEEGSVFGGCTCGYPKTQGIPCHHMVGVVKSCCIEGLNSVNSMPPWWMTAHWRKQYPKETHILCDFNLESLWLSVPDTSYKYCPPYAAPNKAGHPKTKKNKQIKSALEVATEKNRLSRRRQKIPRIR